jgi:hypothetical protein
MGIYKRNFLPSQSQPWTRQVEDTLTAVEARFKTEILNNRTRDEQLQASYNRLDKTVQTVAVAAAAASTAAALANNALSGLISLGTDGSTYDVAAGNINAGNINGVNIIGGTLKTAGTRHVEINQTSANFFDDSGNNFGTITATGSNNDGSATLDIFTPNSSIILANGGLQIASNGLVSFPGGNGVSVSGGPFSCSAGANIGGGLQVGIISSTGASNFTSGTFSGSVTRSALDGGGTTGASFNNSGSLQRTTSSIRYKDDVKPLQINLEDILAMSPVSFKRKDESESQGELAREYAGFIAEDLAGGPLDIFVAYERLEDGSRRPDGVYYGELTAALVSAMKEQGQLMMDLEARLTALETK